MFDITIFPLTLDTGREQYEVPGFYVASAPRRAARLRAQDKLFLYGRLLNLMGEAQPGAFTHTQQEDIYKGLAETYFTAPGSVTAGLRAVVAQLNEFLFHRNRKGGASSQLFGVLNIAALHGDSLIVAHGGPAHTFLLGDKQTAHYDDSASGGRGLGLAGQAVPRFYQAALEPGNLLIFASDAPANWNARTFADGAKLPFDQLRRRLVTGVSTDVSAAVIRFQPGKGQVTYWRPAGQPAAPAAVPPRPSRIPTRTGFESISIMPPGVPASPVEEKPQAAPSTEDLVDVSPAPLEESAAAQEPDEDLIGAGSVEIFDHPDTAPVSAPSEGSEAEILTEPLDASLETVDFSASDTAEVEEEPETPSAPLVDQPAQPLPRSGVFLGDSTVKETSPAGPQLPTAAPRPSHRPVETAREDAGHENAQQEYTGVQSDPTHRSTEKSISRRPTGQKPGLFGWLRRPGQQQPQASSPAASRRPSAGQSRAVPPPLPAPPPAPLPDALEAAEPAGEPPSENLRRGLASAVRSGRKARARVGSAAAKVLPNQPFFNFSSGVMLSIAIMIPLVVVAVALTVYLRAGYSEKFNAKMAMAQQFLLQAQQQQDPVQQRDSWKQVYILVNDALSYEPNNQQARDLRRQALSTIDNLEGFVRMDYQPLRDGLGTNVNITRMIATLTGVYLLDSDQGRVYRLQSTASGYSVDPNFNCGPGKAGSQIITQLIDLAELPVNNQFHADILAIDAGGNLVYCSSGADGFDSQPLPPPDNGWGTIKAITSLGDSLFVLDPKGNAVYRYDGQNGVFNTGPHLYFDTDIPHMANVTDLAVDQEFLYLLHDSGEMTVCDSGGVSYAVTKCTDPTPYGDTRPGYEPSPLVFKGSHFTHIQATQPPDPALYALDAKNHAIYHMSLRLLNLQRQYLPQPETDFPLPERAPTAFVITTNRRAILAFGNQIYFAPIP